MIYTIEKNGKEKERKCKKRARHLIQGWDLCGYHTTQVIKNGENLATK